MRQRKSRIYSSCEIAGESVHDSTELSLLDNAINTQSSSVGPIIV